MCIFIYVYKTIIIKERQNSEHEYWGDIQEFGWVAGEIYEILKKNWPIPLPRTEVRFIYIRDHTTLISL